MNPRRELISGLLAALVSIIIIGGSFAISFAEDGLSLTLAPAPASTSTTTPTVLIPTPLPGEPTHTPSPSPLPTTPTIPPSPTSSCPMPSGWVIITIGPGYTLNSLAQLYNITPETLAEANCLIISKLTPGTTLYVPGPLPTSTPNRPSIPTPSPVHCGAPQGWVLYTVQQGDTLYSIGVARGVNVAQLQAANCMGNSTIIKIGQRIYVPNVPTVIPSSTATATPTPTPTLPPTLTPIPPTATHTLEATTAAAPSETPTPTGTVSTETPSATPTSTSTSTDTPTPLPTLTPTFTPSPTATSP